MENERAAEIVPAILRAGRRGILALAGGGGDALAAILRTPGASGFLLEARVPYAREAMIDFLGGPPDDFASAATARALAMAAFERAMQLAAAEPGLVDRETAERLLGLGCAASLASDRPKRGAHRVHVAVQTAQATLLLSLVMKKGARSRAEEEQSASSLVLSALAEACAAGESPAGPLLPGETIEKTQFHAPEEWSDLLLGAVDAVCLERESGDASEEGAVEEGVLEGEEVLAAEGELEEEGGEPTTGLIFPGAFHPLHAGHRRMAEAAARRLGRPVEYEISIENVDKPPLDFLEIDARRSQFPESPLWLTRAPTFREKARLFPGATFVVGLDTLLRIAEPRYYSSLPQRDAALRELKELGCRFLVFGRSLGGRFQTLGEVEVPPDLRELCDEVPAAEFRCDLSSTELRRECAEEEE